jgi:hypothetical protein
VQSVASLSEFAGHLRDLIRATPDAETSWPDETFKELALKLFALQRDHNEPYRRLCEARRVDRGSQICDWREIPSVPTSAFKDFELTCLQPAERTTVFHSSGTTEHRPSRHFHDAESLRVYEESLVAWFGGHLQFEERIPIISLTPPQITAPHSSLVYMFESLRGKFGSEASTFVGRNARDGGWTVDVKAAVEVLRQSVEINKPILILGTAFSYVHLLDYLAGHDISLKLPAGSYAMETGGYKGRSRSLPKEELHQLMCERLGILEPQILCEYGMSELSSQAYDKPAMRFHFPPWARMQIISPETGREVSDGETGLIRIFDLANVFSVIAIQTEDLAIKCGDGFELLGRASLAEPRGCSLMAV